MGDLDIYKVSFLDVDPPYYVMNTKLYNADSVAIEMNIPE